MRLGRRAAVMVGLMVAVVRPAGPATAGPAATSRPRLRPRASRRLATVPVRRPPHRRQPLRDDDHPGERPVAHAGMAGPAGQHRLQLLPAVVNGVVYIGSIDGRLWAYPATVAARASAPPPLEVDLRGPDRRSPTVANGRVYVGSQTSSPLEQRQARRVRRERLRPGQSARRCGRDWRDLSRSSIRPRRGERRRVRRVVRPPAVRVRRRRMRGGAVQAAVDGNDGGHHRVDPDRRRRGARRLRRRQALRVPGRGLRPIRLPAAVDGPLGFPVFDSSPPISRRDRVHRAQRTRSGPRSPPRGVARVTCQPLWRGQYQGDQSTSSAGPPPCTEAVSSSGWRTRLGVFDANGCGQACVRAPVARTSARGAQAAVLSSPTVANGVVYAGRNTCRGSGLDGRSPAAQFICNEIWRGATNEQIVSSSPTVVNGTLYIGSADKLPGGHLRPDLRLRPARSRVPSSGERPTPHRISTCVEVRTRTSTHAPWRPQRPTLPSPLVVRSRITTPEPWGTRRREKGGPWSVPDPFVERPLQASRTHHASGLGREAVETEGRTASFLRSRNKEAMR